MATKAYGPIACCAVCALFLAYSVIADDAGPKPMVVGSVTEAILTLQREGTLAGTLQPISGEVAARSYQRYLGGFAKPIPEFNETAGLVSKPETSK